MCMTLSSKTCILHTMETIKNNLSYPIVEAFGIVPIKRGRNQWLVFTIRHMAGHWGFPKGHRDNEHETPQECAQRELKEETNLTVHHYFPLDPFFIEYICRSHEKDVYKIVTYFPALVRGTPQVCPTEISEGLWLTLDQAIKTIPFEHMQNMLRKLQRQLFFLSIAGPL